MLGRGVPVIAGCDSQPGFNPSERKGCLNTCSDSACVLWGFVVVVCFFKGNPYYMLNSRFGTCKYSTITANIISVDTMAASKCFLLP